MLSDGRLERAGRDKKSSICTQIPANSNGLDSLDLHKTSLLTASAIVVEDEILFGIVKDQLGPSLSRNLRSVCWSVSQVSIVHNNILLLKKLNGRNLLVIWLLYVEVLVVFVWLLMKISKNTFRHISSNQCNSDWNKMAQFPEGATELLHHDKLSVPLIKCQNVVVLAYVSRNVTTNLSDVEIVQPLTKLCLEVPDLYFGTKWCHRKFRYGSLLVSFTGMDQARIELAVKALYKKFGSDIFMDMN
ncbi:hypothetical protein K1719_031821 [Acacia pycnantha]|nr:hypothetical protein K1719_031821 [Acacia pycnantha]